MTDRSRHQRKNPNPQGKGLVPVLLDLQGVSVARPQRKSPAEFFRDYCASSLVLAADFRFKPVPNKPYYLYSTATGWNLSMVSPPQWRHRPPGDFVANCELRDDMTWAVTFDERSREGSVREKLEAHVEGFIHSFDHKGSIESALPYYVAGLPYYRRVMAAALAASLYRSLPTDVDLQALALSLDDGRDLLAPPPQRQ